MFSSANASSKTDSLTFVVRLPHSRANALKSPVQFSVNVLFRPEPEHLASTRTRQVYYWVECEESDNFNSTTFDVTCFSIRNASDDCDSLQNFWLFGREAYGQQPSLEYPICWQWQRISFFSSYSSIIPSAQTLLGTWKCRTYVVHNNSTHLSSVKECPSRSVSGV